MNRRNGAEPTMDGMMWSLVSLTVAGVALTVIGLPIGVGIRRALRAVRRRYDFGRRLHPAQEHPTPETAIAEATAVAVAVPAQSARAASAPGGIGVGIGVLHQALLARLVAETIPPYPDFRPLSQTLSALTPLERAIWQAHERRGLPRAVCEAWEAGPQLEPGRYPLIDPRDEQRQRQLPGLERTRIYGTAPMSPGCDAWN